MLFSAGGMGAGKGYVVGQSGLFNLKSFVKADPDAFKQMMPEFACVANNQADPFKAGSYTHKESGYISELVQHRALMAGLNLFIDGSFRDGEYYRDTVIPLYRELYGSKGYKFGLIHVETSDQLIKERIESRAKIEKRAVNVDWALAAAQGARKSVELLRETFDFVVVVDNNGEQPCIESFNQIHEKLPLYFPEFLVDTIFC